MKTLIIGDTHIKNVPSIPGYIDAQIEAISRIICAEKDLDNIIFLGDIFHNRRPTPTELLKFREVLSSVYVKTKVFLIRGNHESETKSDDGVTALSLYSENVITHTKTVGKYTFIPHYENQKTIEEALSSVPKGNFVFGHFGFDGCLNSIGNADFSIKRSNFNNPTFLGHIHTFREEARVTLMGTPYTTSFQESGKTSYYGVLEHEDDQWSFKKNEITWGIRHVTLDYSDLATKQTHWLQDENYFTILRIFMNELDGVPDMRFKKWLIDKYKIKYLDIKFKPVEEEKGEEQSSFTPGGDVFQVTDDLIQKYVDGQNSDLSKEDIMKGLEELRRE
tara:strand:+ start:4232 stop:5233 length:1002 start_codon:yes stop_codon:yes gene_type:complete